jgi:inner membrane protein
LLLSSIYLCYCLANKWQIDRRVEQDLLQQGIRFDSYFTTPTPLNNWLWYVVARDSSGYHSGYRSVFDSKDRAALFRPLPRNDSLLKSYQSRSDVQVLLKFARGYYTLDRWQDTLVFNVLRFGEIKGWDDPQARFVFHYFLDYPGENGLVVQRGRFTGWNRQTMLSFISRIRGN